MKKLVFSFLFFLLSSDSSFAAEIEGFWRSVNIDTGKTRCILAIYPDQEIYYGRIIATCDKEGNVDDSIYAPVGRAPGVVGNPYYAGLDIIWGLRQQGSKYRGKILDPEKGNVYKAALWSKNGNLIVRGEFLLFGRNEIWYPAMDTDFPEGFVKPDLTKMTPDIPKVK